MSMRLYTLGEGRRGEWEWPAIGQDVAVAGGRDDQVSMFSHAVQRSLLLTDGYSRRCPGIAPRGGSDGPEQSAGPRCS